MATPERSSRRVGVPAGASSLKRIRFADDCGDTMLEVLIATTLVGIAFAAIFGGLSTASLAAKQQSDSVQIEAALSEAKQKLELATFDPTGAYPGVILPTPSCGTTVTKVVSQVMAASPTPTATPGPTPTPMPTPTPTPTASPTPVPISQVQRITLQATCGTHTRVAETVKGRRPQ